MNEHGQSNINPKKRMPMNRNEQPAINTNKQFMEITTNKQP
jgi:hypothetical protein